MAVAFLAKHLKLNEQERGELEGVISNWSRHSHCRGNRPQRGRWTQLICGFLTATATDRYVDALS
jgi:hypothetical protein